MHSTKRLFMIFSNNNDKSPKISKNALSVLKNMSKNLN